MAKENNNLANMNIWVNLLIINMMAQVFLNKKMELFTKVLLKRENLMEKDN